MAYSLPEDLREKLAQKRLIFTITSGRSGTRYLRHMFYYIPDVQAVQHTNPGYKDVLLEVKQNPSAAYEFLIETKLPIIADYPEPIYIDSDHIFCKGFFEPIIELGIVPDVILLRRNNRDISKSMYQLGHIPERSNISDHYLISPVDNVFVPISDWETLNDYQLCYWYCLEIEYRRVVYGERIRQLGGQAYDLTLEEFSTIRGYYRFLKEAELPYPNLLNTLKYLKNHITRYNNKDKVKKEIIEEIDWETLENEVIARIPQDVLRVLSLD